MRYLPAVAYDAATSSVVLFGGSGSGTGGQGSAILGDTWTWNGSTWTQQAPATSPPGYFAATGYDAATASVVLFGGEASPGAPLGDTWTWG